MHITDIQMKQRDWKGEDYIGSNIDYYHNIALITIW